MSVYQFKQNDYLLSTDKNLLQTDVIHTFLAAQSYWAKDIPKSVVEKSIDASLCFGIYHNDEQVGFARVISDYATFAYLCDVFITDEHLGKGLSKWMMEKIMEHPDLQAPVMLMNYTGNSDSENRIMPATTWKYGYRIFI